MTEIVLWSIVFVGLAGLVAHWRWRAGRSSGIDRLAAKYNVKRWEDESDEHLLERIRDRIMITGAGGKRW